MTVKELRERFEAYVEILELFDDELEIPMRNTRYGICGDYLYLDGFPERGCIDLDSLQENLDKAKYEFDGDEEVNNA